MTFKFVDPCETPISLTASPQNPLNPYEYTGTTPSVDFCPDPPFVSNPAQCMSFTTYACSNTGPNINMCTLGTFDSATGCYNFDTISMVDCPPGTYTFEITATLGDKSTPASIVLIMSNPCPSATLILSKPVDFVDNEYILRDAGFTYEW